MATTVTVTPESASFASLGDTVRLGARVLDENGQVIENAMVSWASSEPDIARVNHAGLVTSSGNGTARVTATSGQASGAATIDVEQVATGIRVFPSVDTLRTLGGTLQLSATVSDANDRVIREAEVVWVSSDTLVVTVDAAGLATATGNGSAAVSATSRGLSETVSLTVYDVVAAIATDREALVALYHATGGANWIHNANWLSEGELSTWVGVRTNEEGRVEQLSLGPNRLTGEMPPELGNLTALKGLFLGANDLWGSIPPELGNLSELQLLWLDQNSLTGSLPPELGKLRKLRSLNLSENELEGPIPPEFGDMASLQNLRMEYNRLEGPIPPEFGRLGDLEVAWLSWNRLQGPLPATLGDLASLELLNLARNQLTGSIPPELGDLPALTSLTLSWNQLTGSIPPKLGDLATIQNLFLHANQLTGAIPPELGRLSSLTRLDLSINQFAGAVPAEFGNLVNLGRLDLSANQELSGPLPSEFTTLAALGFLAINRTRLCVPQNTAFDNWLANIQFQGARCAP